MLILSLWDYSHASIDVKRTVTWVGYENAAK